MNTHTRPLRNALRDINSFYTPSSLFWGGFYSVCLCVFLFLLYGMLTVSNYYSTWLGVYEMLLDLALLALWIVAGIFFLILLSAFLQWDQFINRMKFIAGGLVAAGLMVGMFLIFDESVRSFLSRQPNIGPSAKEKLVEPNSAYTRNFLIETFLEDFWS